MTNAFIFLVEFAGHNVNKSIKMLCQGQLPRGTRERGQIKVAFPLEKSVRVLEIRHVRAALKKVNQSFGAKII